MSVADSAVVSCLLYAVLQVAEYVGLEILVVVFQDLQCHTLIKARPEGIFPAVSPL